MDNDRLLAAFMEPARWKEAIDKGMEKGLSKKILYELTKPETRTALKRAIGDGTYTPAPPHTALIPKDDGTYREVRIAEDEDRVIFSVANDVLFGLCGSMVHPACRSYLKGTGCARTVREIAARLAAAPEGTAGWKADLSKYFDSVPAERIEETFGRVEELCGKSALTDMLRRYYRSDLLFDEKGELTHRFMSLQQGCAVAAFLADACLHGLDERLSAMDGLYVRYSDDILFLGPDADRAMEALMEELAVRGLTLNPKKVEAIGPGHRFKFLGFSIRGGEISLSAGRIKKFQKEVQAATTKRRRPQTLHQAVRRVNRLLYGGPDGHSWATQVLGTVNSARDVDTLNAFAMDCLRAVQTGRTSTGGLGYDRDGRDGCVVRGKGRNVRSNRERTQAEIPGYMTLGCMRNALLTDRDAYAALVAELTA